MKTTAGMAFTLTVFVVALGMITVWLCSCNRAARKRDNVESATPNQEYVVHWEGGTTLDQAVYYVGDQLAGKGREGFERTIAYLENTPKGSTITFTSLAEEWIELQERFQTPYPLPLGADKNSDSEYERFEKVFKERDLDWRKDVGIRRETNRS